MQHIRMLVLIFIEMKSLTVLFSVYLKVVSVASSTDNTQSSYIHNVDAIIGKQLKNPREEDADDIRDNVEEFNTLLADLLNCVQRKDPIALDMARRYWDNGSSQFFIEKYFGELRSRLEDEFDWPDRKAQELARLVAKSKSLWSMFETWYKNQYAALPQF